jgi:hypothetical protein
MPNKLPTDATIISIYSTLKNGPDFLRHVRWDMHKCRTFVSELREQDKNHAIEFFILTLKMIEKLSLAPTGMITDHWKTKRPSI